MRIVPVVLTLAIALTRHEAGAQSEGASGGSGQTRVTSDTTVALNKGGLLEIEMGTSDININGWDRAGVRVLANPAQRALRVSGSASTVTVSRASGTPPGRVDVWVPAGVHVAVSKVSGTLTVTRVEADIEVESQSGGTTLTEVKGTLDVSSVAGDVVIKNASGTIDASMVTGRLDIDGASGELNIEGVDGNVSLANITATNMNVEWLSGSVVCSSAIPRDANWSFESFAGSIRMRVPPASNARFTMESFSGNVRSTIPMVEESGSGGRGGMPGARRVLRLGNGNANVSFESFSGALIIEALTNREPGSQQ